VSCLGQVLEDKLIGSSDEDLNILLDRSAAAFAREKGWSAGLGKAGAEGRAEKIKKGEKTAFEASNLYFLCGH